jgi:hypothetical protein
MRPVYFGSCVGCVVSRRKIRDATRKSISGARTTRRALLASGQINMRRVDGGQNPGTTLIDQQFDFVA